MSKLSEFSRRGWLDLVLFVNMTLLCLVHFFVVHIANGPLVLVMGFFMGTSLTSFLWCRRNFYRDALDDALINMIDKINVPPTDTKES